MKSSSALPYLFLALSVSTVGALAAGCGDSDDANDPNSETNDASTAKDGSSSGDDSTEDSGSTTDGSASGDASSDAAVVTGPFNVNPNGAVFASLHVGNSWYLGGDFTAVNATAAPRFLAIDSSGAPSTTCKIDSGFNGPVAAVVKAGGSVYVGGSFLAYKGQPVNRVAKLDASTCALDTTFSPPANTGFNDAVTVLAASGTSLYVGGAFSAYRGVANSASRLAKLDLNTGALDTTFSPGGANANGFDSTVYSLAVSGTSLYVGGAFNAYKGVYYVAQQLAKLDLTTGALDATFSPPGLGNNGFDSTVFALAVSGSSLYAGGVFSKYRNVANSASKIAKLDLASGALDTTFSPPGANLNGFNSIVYTLGVSGSSLYVGGAFTDYRGSANVALRLAKVDLTSGVLDTTFSPSTSNGFNGEVTALAVVGSSVFVGGTFDKYKGTVVNRIAKISATTGALDTAFGPPGKNVKGVENAVNVIASDGTTLWVGGYFRGYGGNSANRIAKLDDKTYALDQTFSPLSSNGFDQSVQAFASDGKSLYVGGPFNDYRGVAGSAKRIAKLDLASGALDTTFSPPANNGFDQYVRALVVSGTSVYAGGAFSAYRGVADSAHAVAKLDLTTGAIDTAFSSPGATANGFDERIDTLLLNGSSLYVGGRFTAYRGVADSAHALAKLDLTSGAIDTTFSPVGSTANGFDQAVFGLATLGTSLYATGYFNAYKGVADSAHRIAKLDLTTGALDTTFSPPGATSNGFNTAATVVATAGDAVYVGGDFTDYKGVANSANHLAKLNATSGALDTTFSPPGASANGFGPGAAFYSMAAHAGSVFVGGDALLSYRGTTALGIVKIDGTTGVLQ